MVHCCVNVDEFRPRPDRARRRTAPPEADVLPREGARAPVVLMEAMTTAIPVVAPRLTAIPELVEHGVSGLLFTSGSPPSWRGPAEFERSPRRRAEIGRT